MKWILKQAEKGDMVRVKLGSIYHYGVFISEDEIVQFGLAPSMRATVKDSDIEICISDVDTFLAGSFLEVAVFDRAERKKHPSPEEAAKTALSRVGEKGYNILYNNCEHFAYECVTGKKYCSQTENVRNFFKSLPVLDLYVSVIPKDISVADVEPELKNKELQALSEDGKRREDYFAWRLLEYALEHSFCFRIKGLKCENGVWYSDKFKFDICVKDGIAAVAVSKKDVQLEMINLSENIDIPRDGKARLEIITLQEKQYGFLIRNESVGALKVHSDHKIK